MIKEEATPASARAHATWTRPSGWVCALLLAAGFAFSASAAPPPREPSEAELHAMYCAEVLRGEIALQQRLFSESSEAAGVARPELREQWIDTSAELLQRLAQLEGALYQLQAYMLPRIAALNALALAAAIRQADTDVQDSREDPGHLQFQQTVAADSPWSGVALLNRVRACESPTWLL